MLGFQPTLSLGGLDVGASGSPWDQRPCWEAWWGHWDGEDVSRWRQAGGREGRGYPPRGEGARAELPGVFGREKDGGCR